VITGRAKDTIVLSNGENIEPQPIEDACLRSEYISQIVIVGQDQKYLGALIVPNLEALQQWADRQNLPLDLEHSQIKDLFRTELTREVKNRPGYRADDRIAVIKPILEPFSIENGLLTQTLKIRRPVVMERYQDMINEMFKRELGNRE
jgi:long-chain acyl-CoA synthetase